MSAAVCINFSAESLHEIAILLFRHFRILASGLGEEVIDVSGGPEEGAWAGV